MNWQEGSTGCEHTKREFVTLEIRCPTSHEFIDNSTVSSNVRLTAGLGGRGIFPFDIHSVVSAGMTGDGALQFCIAGSASEGGLGGLTFVNAQ